MRDPKVHFLVDIRRTSPPCFSTVSSYVLCNLHTAQRVTKDRALVTCNVCNHFIAEYGDKHVIERGNAPAAVLSETERLNAYRAAALRYTIDVNGAPVRVKVVGGMVFLED